MKHFNIYCDESCHLEHDHLGVMVLGAIWCPKYKAHEIFKDIREIKAGHNLSKEFEIKWTKVSASKIEFYLELVDYFFNSDFLHFRALVVPDKSQLRHADFGQDHDTWYYKMYFDMLKIIITPHDKFRIFVDYKDTHGSRKIAKLHEVLCNNQYDFSREIIEEVQLVRSHEVELIQLADLLIGAIAYVNRNLQASQGKLRIVERIRELSGYSLTKTTLVSEPKLNLFIWRVQEAHNA